MFKKGFLSFLLLASAIPNILYSYTGLNNSGIISGNIWFSKNPFFEGELVRIYTAIYNSSDAALEGDVNFYDSNILLGTKRFAVPSGGNLQDVFINWKATEGDHKFSAKLTNTQVSVSGGKPEAVTISSAETAEKVVAVETDTDGDQISNKEEIKAGTDPHSTDTDKDGIPDNIDKLPLDKYNGNPPPAPVPATKPDQGPVTSASPAVSAISNLAQAVTGNGPVSAYGQKAVAAVGQADNQVASLQAVVKNIAGDSISKIKTDIASRASGGKASAIIATTTPPTKNTVATKSSEPDKSFVPEAARTPFDYVKLAFWYLVYFLFYSTWTLYLFMLFIIYWAFKKWRRRREYYA